ncbi:MAG: hypothetical protein NZM31_02820 [Gemmatales bacterium]|nr:hypothetical protein [Gemmatales bacterium]MDW8385933.1 hypothetical protein [Gemmatales bacterium]
MLEFVALSQVILGIGLAMPGAGTEPYFDPPQIELGEVRTGQSRRLSLWLGNPTAEPLNVARLVGSCGCVRILEVPTTIPARGRVAVPVEIHTLSATPGSHLWTVQALLTGSARQYAVVAAIRAQVFQEIVVQPPSLQVIGSGPTQHEIRVTDLRGHPIRILKTESSNRFITASEPQPGRDPLGRMVWSLAVSIGAELPPGQHHEVLTLHTDDPQHRELRIPISVVRRGGTAQRIQALPEQLDVVVSAAQPEVKRLVTLRDRQGGPLAIEYVLTSDEALSCRMTTGSGGTPAVEITVSAAKMKSDRLVTRIVVHLSEPKGEKVIIPVRVVRQ